MSRRSKSARTKVSHTGDAFGRKRGTTTIRKNHFDGGSAKTGVDLVISRQAVGLLRDSVFDNYPIWRIS